MIVPTPIIEVPPSLLSDADLRRRVEQLVTDVKAGRLSPAAARASLPPGCRLRMLKVHP